MSSSPRSLSYNADACQFVAEIGATLISAVAPMRFVQRSLSAMAAKFHLDCEFLVLPDAVVVLGSEQTPRRRVVNAGPALRYDQMQKLYQLARAHLGWRGQFGRWITAHAGDSCDASLLQ